MIVAGETGSGKTTQLPKICLELGRGVRGVIGHTQPRRIAARTVAERIAEELGVELGSTVGYQVRFTDRAGEDTAVKVMTDGILLAEIQHDRMLRRYDTIIIDEAHERSLNIDFLLGYLKQLLPRRPDLKLIITSATIDPERFAAHFGGRARSSRSPAGRTRSRCATGRRPRTRPTERDQVQAISDAVDELGLEAPGDVLVFLLRRAGDPRHRRGAAQRRCRRPPRCCRCYARLSAAEQHRVFAPHAGPPDRAGHQRRRDLAHRARHPLRRRPRHRADLPLQRPDQGAAAADRADLAGLGRPARRAAAAGSPDGICIRLYAEEDFAGRPRFTEPEILRTNLASVILQMTALDLGDVAAFPFLDPPDRRVGRRRRARCCTSWARWSPAPSEAPADPGRPQAGPAADRPAARPDGARGRAATAACARCW